ncbi:amidohydrolase [Candidatus Saccharibacteria bacterium]|nr:amidohydrolase [Candidatus Saccharibacteria bacterium]
MGILIKNCNLISMAESRERYEPGMDILIEDGKIKKIGKNLDAVGGEVIDAAGKIVMPGFINTHSHIAMSIFRETLDGYSLQDWLEKKIWPMEDKLTPEDIHDASLLSFVEMVKTGTVMANDQYFLPENSIRAAGLIGVRLMTTRTVFDLSNNPDKMLAEQEELIKKYYKGRCGYEKIYLNVGIHGLYTTGKDTVEKAVAIAKKYDVPVHMHFCENEQEVKDIKKNYGVESPVDVLEKYFSDVHTILAHVVKVSDEEIDRLAKLNVSVAHCPVSNMRLGCGIAKIQQMLDKGINVSLGTDGQGSGSNLDMFDSMKFAALLQKGEFENAGYMDSYEVLKMATINGAKALGVADEIGSVEEGKSADIIIVDLSTPVCQPVGNVFSDLVYNAKGSNVCMTIINGKVVMRDGVVEGCALKTNYKKCADIIARIS